MYLGIDVGTTGVKCTLIDETAEVIASRTEPLSVSHPHPLWSEQNPDDWWQATQSAIRALSQQYRQTLSRLKAIGLSGQMHGATLLDKHDKVLRPAILWNDGRSFLECDELAEKTKALKITGNLVMPAFTAPKLNWVKKNEPDVFSKVAKVLLPKDYLRLKLSGDYACDMSDASGTSWLNTKERAWSDEMLSACDLTCKHMPALFEGNEITGTLLKALADDWGLPHDVKIVAGAGDNAASAISLNAVNDGDAFLSLGTSGVYGVTSSEYHSNPKKAVHAYCHCIPERWQQMTVHLSSASCLRWGAKLLNLQGVHQLIEKAQAVGKTQVIFLPYLSGERTPHNDPHAKGVFFGMDNRTSDADLALAILEGVALSLSEGQDALYDAGVNVNKLAVVGGGARSLFWGGIIASVFDRELFYYADREVGAAFGAARLAYLALNPDAKFESTELETTIAPKQGMHNYYQHKKTLFANLYQSLKPNFPELLQGEQ